MTTQTVDSTVVHLESHRVWHSKRRRSEAVLEAMRRHPCFQDLRDPDDPADRET